MTGHMWFRRDEDDDEPAPRKMRLIKFRELLIVCSSRVPPISFTINGVGFHLPMTDIWIPIWSQNG